MYSSRYSITTKEKENKEESEDEGHKERKGSEPKGGVLALGVIAVVVSAGLEGAKVALVAIFDVPAEVPAEYAGDGLDDGGVVVSLAVGAVDKLDVLAAGTTHVLAGSLEEGIELLLSGFIAVVLDFVEGGHARVNI